MKEKLEELEKIIDPKANQSLVYKNIMEYGKTIINLEEPKRIKENIVNGCQSTLYLSHEVKNGKIYFSFYTEALISKGLAAILTHIYSGEDPKTIFTTPLSKLPIASVFSKVSMQRQTGIGNLYKQMQLLSAKYI